MRGVRCGRAAEWLRTALGSWCAMGGPGRGLTRQLEWQERQKDGAIRVIGAREHEVATAGRVGGGGTALALWVIGDSLNGRLNPVGEVAAADEQEHGRLRVAPYDVAEQLVDRSGD